MHEEATHSMSPVNAKSLVRTLFPGRGHIPCSNLQLMIESSKIQCMQNMTSSWYYCTLLTVPGRNSMEWSSCCAGGRQSCFSSLMLARECVRRPSTPLPLDSRPEEGAVRRWI